MILTVGLILLWAYQLDHWSIIQGSLWCCDVVMATCLLVKFSQPTTAAPGLLPVLAYEAEAYWSRIGGILGSLATAFLLILVWWLRPLVASQYIFDLIPRILAGDDLFAHDLYRRIKGYVM